MSVVLACALSVYIGVCLQVTTPGSPLAFFTTIVPHAANLYTMIARMCHLCYFDDDGDGGRRRDMGGGGGGGEGGKGEMGEGGGY